MVNLYLYIRHILFWHICWQRFAIAARFSQIKHIGISMISKKTVAEYVVLVYFGQAAHSGHSTEAHREQSCMADNIANLGGLNPGVVTNGIGWWLSTVMAITHPTCNMYLFYPFLIFSFNACKPTPRSIVPVSVSNQNRTVLLVAFHVSFDSQNLQQNQKICVWSCLHISATLPLLQCSQNTKATAPQPGGPHLCHLIRGCSVHSYREIVGEVASQADKDHAGCPIPKANPKKPHGLKMIESPKWMVGIRNITKCVCVCHTSLSRWSLFQKWA